MKRLTVLVKVFKEILEKNLLLETPNHYEIMNCLGTVFNEANKSLVAFTTLEQKAKVFDLMKTLGPYLLSKKKEILEKLGQEGGEKSLELKLAVSVYEKESKEYAVHLEAANKEKGTKTRKKIPSRDYL
jgi:hypothetical protein